MNVCSPSLSLWLVVCCFLFWLTVLSSSLAQLCDGTPSIAVELRFFEVIIQLLETIVAEHNAERERTQIERRINESLARSVRYT